MRIYANSAKNRKMSIKNLRFVDIYGITEVIYGKYMVARKHQKTFRAS